MALKIISIHIPKTAGTSLSYAFWEHFGDAFFIDGTHDPCNPANDLNESSELPPGVRCVHGHFRADRYADNSDAYLLTFLREPINNLLSIYYFWKVSEGFEGDIFARFHKEKPGIIDFARTYPFSNFLTNLFFPGFDMSRFDFVGGHEYRQNGLSVLSKELGFPIDAERKENVTDVSFKDERQEVQQNEKIMSELRTILKPDIEFYNRHVRPGSYVNSGRIW